MSGPEALSILGSLSGVEAEPEPAKVCLKKIMHPDGNRLIDHALITFFKGPHSFTGEDVVEISCHGSPIILRQVLDLTLSLGARLAEPGEFTLRAVSHGKINLSQAEAIRDLIDARTAAAAQQAVRQVGGELSNVLQPLKDRLLNLIVLLESSLEFAEDDLPEIQTAELRQQLGSLRSDMESLGSTYEVGHLLSDGIKVAIAGRPNVGKSSLFNSLLRLDRAIVTAIPGTTRDTISEQLSIDGIPVLLTDTAGIRVAGDHIEIMGIERTQRTMSDADLLLVVLDGTTELHEDDLSLLAQATEARSVIVVNKSDADGFQNPMTRDLNNGLVVVETSALTGAGLDRLRAAILAPFGSVDSDGVGLLVTNARHHDLLTRACESLKSSEELLAERASEELVLVGLHNALRFLGEITGETTTEDILTRIFATFCIGK
jgi:tRNA modification GTPase